ncbi:MAG: hypothetical protein IPM39_28595 [Chloroflexi bacterium]|nr:hypothetical protein [Chloroflexota bacterium]
MILGVTAALLGSAFTGLHSWGYELVAIVCFALALNMLGALEINVPGTESGRAHRPGRDVYGGAKRAVMEAQVGARNLDGS